MRKRSTWAGYAFDDAGQSRISAVYDGSGKIRSARYVRCGGARGDEGMEIPDWRQKIDELDEQIVQLISRRAEAAKAIGDLKRADSLPVYEPGREQDVFDHVRAANPGPLSDSEMVDVYQRIIDVMRTLQKRDW